MKKAIVVGGAGFVGSAVTKELIARGVDVTVVVRPGFEVTGNRRLADMPVTLVECRLQEIASLPEKLDKGFDVWYQFAWDGLFHGQLLDYTVQIGNIQYMMDAICAAKKVGCSRFIGAGSISQYELHTLEGQISKEDKHRIYKTAKLACEYMGRSVASQQGIQFFWPIITNIYGEGEKSPRLINSLIADLLHGARKALSEGYQIYDFIHVSDAARAFVVIGMHGLENRHYVIASGTAKPLRDFLIELRDIVNPDAHLGFGEFSFNGIDLPKAEYDITQLTEDTGFRPLVSFAEGIRRTTNWIKNKEKTHDAAGVNPGFCVKPKSRGKM